MAPGRFPASGHAAGAAADFRLSGGGGGPVVGSGWAGLGPVPTSKPISLLRELWVLTAGQTSRRPGEE